MDLATVSHYVETAVLTTAYLKSRLTRHHSPNTPVYTLIAQTALS